jgi:hypothetical protein
MREFLSTVTQADARWLICYLMTKAARLCDTLDEDTQGDYPLFRIRLDDIADAAILLTRLEEIYNLTVPAELRLNPYEMRPRRPDEYVRGTEEPVVNL